MQIVLMLIPILIFKAFNIYELITLLICNLIMILFLKKTDAFSSKGYLIYEKVINYANNLKDNSLLKDQKIVYQNLTQKHYINSVALNITTEAKKEFIIDEEVQKRNEHIIKDVVNVICIILYFAYIIMISIRR